MKKKSLTFIGATLLSFVIICSATFAVNTYTGDRSNLFGIANLEGTANEANFIVKNEGNMPAVVRVMILPMVTLADSTDTYLLSHDVLDFDDLETGWEKGGDGYYYYTDLVSPGTSVQVFTHSPTIKSPAPTGFEGAVVNVEIKAEFSSAIKYTKTDNSDGYTYRDAWFEGFVPANGTLQNIDSAIQNAVNS